MEILNKHIEQGKQYQKSKKFDLAINEFTKAIYDESNNIEAYYWRGFCYYQIRDFNNAIIDFNKIIKIKSDYAKTYYWRGLAYYEIEEKQKAIMDLTQAIKLNPRDVTCYYRRANIWYQSNDLEKALQDLEQIITLSPNYVEALFLISQIKYKMGDNQTALETLNTLIDLKSDYPEAYHWRGLTKLKLKNFDNSLEDLEQAAQIYRVQGKNTSYQEVKELINSVHQEIEVLQNHISIKTLDSLNLDRERKNLDNLIKKDNPNVYDFDQDIIKTYLKKNDIKYLQDSEGDLLIQFHYDEEINGELTIYLMAGGKNKKIYTISMRNKQRIPEQKWDTALLLCNKWNLESRWPTACFFPSKKDKYGIIILDYHMDLEAGIHQELFDYITSQIISSGYQFWLKYHQYF